MSEPSLEVLLQEHHIERHVWVATPDEALAAARQLRRETSPGARLLLAQRPARSTWERLRRILVADELELSTADVFARSLLCAGLEAPTVLANGPELVAVSGQVPALVDPLDDAFV